MKKSKIVVVIVVLVCMIIGCESKEEVLRLEPSKEKKIEKKVQISTKPKLIEKKQEEVEEKQEEIEEKTEEVKEKTEEVEENTAKSSEKYIVKAQNGDLLEISISQKKAIEIVNEKLDYYFGVEIKKEDEIFTILETKRNSEQAFWIIMSKNERYRTMSMIDAENGEFLRVSYDELGQDLNSGKLNNEEAKELSKKYLKDKELSKDEIEYLGLNKDYMAKNNVCLDFKDSENNYTIGVNKITKNVCWVARNKINKGGIQ